MLNYLYFYESMVRVMCISQVVCVLILEYFTYVSVVEKKMPPLFAVLSSVLCFEFIFSATHKCNSLCHEAITVQVTISGVCSTFFRFQLEFHDINLVKLWTGESMKIYRSFVTTIWNQVMSLLSVKLRGTHVVSCTVMATWHRVLH